MSYGFRRAVAGIGLLLLTVFCGCGRAEADPEVDRALRTEAAHCFGEVALAYRSPGRAEVRDASGAAVGFILYSASTEEMAQGFRGPVPAAVFCDADGKILHVTLLPNREDTSYLAKVAANGLAEEWCGFDAARAAELPVDTVTGATYSSRAAIESVRTLLLRHNRN